MKTWREYIEAVTIKTVSQRMSEQIPTTYEAVRRWVKEIVMPDENRRPLLVSVMRTQLTPDEYEDFRASLVADLLGEREANSPPPEE